MVLFFRTKVTMGESQVKIERRKLSVGLIWAFGSVYFSYVNDALAVKRVFMYTHSYSIAEVYT